MNAEKDTIQTEDWPQKSTKSTKENQEKKKTKRK